MTFLDKAPPRTANPNSAIGGAPRLRVFFDNLSPSDSMSITPCPDLKLKSLNVSWNRFAEQSWAPISLINVIVRNGVVHLWGALTDERQRQGIRVAAENTAGVKSVQDHLVWIEPTTGMTFPASEEEKKVAAD